MKPTDPLTQQLGEQRDKRPPCSIGSTAGSGAGVPVCDGSTMVARTALLCISESSLKDIEMDVTAVKRMA